MSMNFLTHRAVGSTLSAAPRTIEAELAAGEDNTELNQEILKINMEIDATMASISHIDTALDVANSMLDMGVSTQIVAANFGTHLNASGVPDEVAEQIAVACESEGEEGSNEEISTEMLQSAKDIIMDAVAWLVDHFKKLMDLAKRKFNENFGSIKRGLEAMRKLKSRVESMIEDSYTLEEKGNIEITKGAAYYILGESNNPNPKSVVAWASLPSKIESFDELITKIADGLTSFEVDDFASVSDINVKLNDLRNPTSSAKEFAGSTEFKIDGSKDTTDGIALLGRKVFGCTIRFERTSALGNVVISDMNQSELADTKKYFNGIKYGIMPSNTKLKSLEEVKVKPATLSEIEALVDTYIEMLTTALTLQTNKKIRKIESQLEKAVKSAKKWANDADTDDATAKRVAITAAGMMSAKLRSDQQFTIGIISDVTDYASAVSKAHMHGMIKSLKAYKKDK